MLPCSYTPDTVLATRSYRESTNVHGRRRGSCHGMGWILESRLAIQFAWVCESCIAHKIHCLQWRRGLPLECDEKGNAEIDVAEAQCCWLSCSVIPVLSVPMYISLS